MNALFKMLDNLAQAVKIFSQAVKSAACALSFAPPQTTSSHPMQLHNLIGTAAACLTTLSFIPQALKTFRTKDVSGISLSMYGIFAAGVALWLVYGILLSAWPIIIANAITLSLAIVILAMKWHYGKSKTE
jgi:MtN3 and saliva related transmembrane protein